MFLIEQEHMFVYNEYEVILMARDRGTMKWSSLMLPEHVELLKEMWQEDHKVTKPALDSQQIEILNAQVLEAFEEKSVISVSIYSDGTVFDQVGVITKLDGSKNIITLQSDDSTKLMIAFHDILSITIR